MPQISISEIIFKLEAIEKHSAMISGYGVHETIEILPEKGGDLIKADDVLALINEIKAKQ